MSQSDIKSHTDASISALYARSQTEHSSTELDQRITNYAHQAISTTSAAQRKKSWLQEMGLPLAMAASVILGVIFFRTFVAPEAEVATPGYLAKTDAYLTTPVTTEQTNNTIPDVEQQDKNTRLANNTDQPKTATTQNQQTKQTTPTRQIVSVNKPAKAVKENPKTVFAKKSVSNNPLMAPVNTTIGEPDSMEVWYEEITQLFKDGKETEGKKALDKFLKKYPRHEAALTLQKSLKK